MRRNIPLPTGVGSPRVEERFNFCRVCGHQVSNPKCYDLKGVIFEAKRVAYNQGFGHGKVIANKTLANYSLEYDSQTLQLVLCTKDWAVVIPEHLISESRLTRKPVIYGIQGKYQGGEDNWAGERAFREGDAGSSCGDIAKV